MELQDKWNELKPRVISSMVMALLVIAPLWMGGMFFIALIMFAALQMIREWDAITVNENIVWRLAGLAYVAIPCASIIWLRDTENGFSLVLALLLTIWATDIGAYFAGRKLGGAKLAPSISPNKTWSGLAGGVVCAGAMLGLCTSFSPYPAHIVNAVLLGIVLAVLSQGGDLFESWLKRRAGVKDSSNLIPGHGGLLDRIDGLIPVLPIFALLVYAA